jgi:hypothetical protein
VRRHVEHRRQRPSAATGWERPGSLLAGRPPEQALDGDGGQGRLRQEPDRRTGLDQIGEIVLGVGGDEDQLPGIDMRVVEESSSHVEATFRAEADVDERHVGMQVGRAQDGVRARGRDADDSNALLLEQRSSGPEKARAVIDDQAAQCHWIRLGARRGQAIPASRHPGLGEDGIGMSPAGAGLAVPGGR